MKYYRPGVGWWPKEPLPSGGTRIWDGSLIADFGTMSYIRRPTKEQWKQYVASLKGSDVKPYQRFPSMSNSERLKSSADRKIMQGGPWDGAKIRRYVKLDRTPKISHLGQTKRGATKVVSRYQLTADHHTVPPWAGCYIWHEALDRYLWRPASA